MGSGRVSGGLVWVRLTVGQCGPTGEFFSGYFHSFFMYCWKRPWSEDSGKADKGLCAKSVAKTVNPKQRYVPGGAMEMNIAREQL